MIPCNELRIGNYVLIDKSLQQVSMITSATVSAFNTDRSDGQLWHEYNLENVQPVPLTDDILKQCGFVYHDYFKVWQLITEGIVSDMDVNNDYDVVDFGRRPVVKKIESLHRLQNVLFTMKSKELVIRKKAPSAYN